MLTTASQRRRLARDEAALERGWPRYPHIITRAFRVEGPLDVTDLHLAVRATLDHRPVLRSGLRQHDGAPVLSTDDALDGAWSFRQSDDPIAAWRETTNVTSFEDDPLIRVEVLGRDDLHVVCVRVDHSVADGQSMELVLSDLGKAYDPRRTLPGEPDDGFARFAQREGALIGSPEAADHLAWWSAQLAGRTPVVQLPVALCRDAPAVPSYEALHESVELGLDGTRLRAACARWRCTPFALVSHAVLTTLAEISEGGEDPGITYAMANREPEEASAVGWFANVMTLYCDEPAREAGPRAVMDATMEAAAHQRFPSAEVLRELDPIYYGAPLHKPTIFVSVAMPDEGLTLAGCVTTALAVEEPVTTPGLTALCEVSDQGLSLDWLASSSWVDPGAFSAFVLEAAQQLQALAVPERMAHSSAPQRII
jgi:hypothetical protein